MKVRTAWVILLLSLMLVAIFYYAIHWFHQHPNWQDQNVIFARRVLGKGFKVALNGIDWNRNKNPECIAYIPIKKMQKIAPHLQAINTFVVIEKDSVLFNWKSMDTIAFIPIINSPHKESIPIIFSTSLDSLNPHQVCQFQYAGQFQILKP